MHAVVYLEQCRKAGMTKEWSIGVQYRMLCTYDTPDNTIMYRFNNELIYPLNRLDIHSRHHFIKI